MTPSSLKMAATRLQAIILTCLVVGAFLMSSLAWHHFQGTTQELRICAGALILVLMYALMIFELTNRTLAALVGAALAVAAHDCLVDYVTMEQILAAWVDYETLALLFGMMIIVQVLSSTGLFDYLAIWAYRKSLNHSFWLLLATLALITAILSAFVDNVSTMLLMSPTLIKLAQLEHLDPRYLLMIMILACNIGGCATPVGDPPNLIIIGDQFVASKLQLQFGSFTSVCTPGVLLALVVIYLYLRLRYKSKESFRMSDGSCAIGETESRLGEAEIEQLLKRHSIKRKSALTLSLVVLLLTIVLFFVQSLPNTRLTLGWISLFAALTLLVVTEHLHDVEDDDNNDEVHEQDNFERIVQNIEWSTLIFFFALFIVMEAMLKLGLIAFVGSQITNLIGLLPAGTWRSAGAITIVLWSSAFASALIDNVPFTSMMIKVLGSMDAATSQQDVSSEYPHADPSGSESALDMRALVYALAFGACFGGNGTLIGASANLVTASAAARNNYPITFIGYLKFAAPATLISLLVANVYLVMVFVVFSL